VLLATCGDQQEAPEVVPESEGPVISDATQDTLDSLFGPRGGYPDEEEAPRPRVVVPVLAFPQASGQLPTSGTWRQHPLLADFSGDGLPDLVASNRKEDGLNIWRNDGEGGWELAIEGIPRNLMYGGSAAADLDEDGDLDLIFGAHQDPGMRVFFNDGQMNWTAKPQESIETQALLVDVATGDLNGDGHADIAGIGQFEGGAVVFLGDGKGGLTRVTISIPSSEEGAPATRRELPELSRLRMGTQIEIVDLNDDGLGDLVIVSDKGLRTLFSLRTDDGSVRFEDLSEGLPRPQIGNSLRGVAIADFDGDGKLDLASGGMADPNIPMDEWNCLGLYRRLEDRSWQQFDHGLERRIAQHDVHVADFDQDGHLDLFCIAVGSGGLVWLGDGTGGFTAFGHLPLPGAACRSTLGDVDGDGRTDVIISAGPSKSSPDQSGITVHLNRAGAFE